MADTIRERGHFDTTIGEIVRRAYTSRRTFYEHFSSKEECFLTLHRQRVTEQIRQIAAAVDPEAELPIQVRQAITAWIAGVGADPAIELSWFRDIPRLGEDGRQLLRHFREKFITLIRTLTDTPELRAAGVRPASRHAAVMVLGGLNELVSVTLDDGGDIRDITDVAVDCTLAILDRRG
jgi:AcrR family transcriptional regulator